MSPTYFQSHYTTTTKIICQALTRAARIFCYTPCPNPCPHHYPTHYSPNTLLSQFQIELNDMALLATQPIPHNLPIHPCPPPHILHNRQQYPISTILKHRHKTHLDQYGAQKHITTYLCQWALPTGT
jgi:hypothetical protein